MPRRQQDVDGADRAPSISDHVAASIRMAPLILCNKGACTTPTVGTDAAHASMDGGLTALEV